MKIFRFGHSNGYRSDIAFGFCKLIDGFVCVLSFGYINTDFTLKYARSIAYKRIKNAEKSQ